MTFAFSGRNVAGDREGESNCRGARAQGGGLWRLLRRRGKTPEYIGLMAATWDLFRGDTSEWADRFFFKEAVSRYGQPVLDVGCGTGRLLLDFLADGVDMDGVDNSAEMLRLCREKAASRGLSPTLYEGEMDTLSLPRRYQTIIVPSSSFQLLTNDSAAKAALQRFYDHLLPGGVLIMSLMQFWQEGEGLDSGWFASGEAIGADEVTYRRFARHTVTPENAVRPFRNALRTLGKRRKKRTKNCINAPRRPGGIRGTRPSRSIGKSA